jgi:ParB/RepB/Spo0J family partition protein
VVKQDEAAAAESAAPNESAPPEVRESGDALVTLINITNIAESKENPRKTFGDLDGLAKDIGRRGILQPLLVRPIPTNGRRPDGRYELVFGARRLRAAKIAGLDRVPVMIRSMADDEALETRIIENSQRDDVHPLEEAQGYEWLHEKHGRSVVEIAVKVGKSTSWVYGRMQLLRLCQGAREAFLAGDIDASVAVLLARIPSEALQMEALDQVRETEYEPAATYKEASEVIQNHFMLRLKNAPFKLDDGELVPAAGPCWACPKRTGNQPELFDDVKGADMCIDPECFAKKRDARNAELRTEIEERGTEFLKPGTANRIFKGSDLAYASGFVDLDRPCEFDEKKPQRTYRAILSESDVPIVAAENPHTHKIHELVKDVDAKKALKEAGIGAGKGMRIVGSSAPTADEKRQRINEQIRKRRVELLTAAIVEKAEVSQPAAEFWSLMARFAVKRAWHDVLKRVISRRGLNDSLKKGEAPDEALLRLIGAMTAGQARGLMLEAMMGQDTQFGEESDDVKALAHLYDLKVDAFATRARNEVNAKAGKTKIEKKAPKKSRAESPAKKGAPRKKKDKAEPGFDVKMIPSPELAMIVGEQPITRMEVTKRLWEYIKKNNLQDKKKATLIITDEFLRAVFGDESKVSMFDMTRRISNHLTPIEKNI